jgi:hypothetical protein
MVARDNGVNKKRREWMERNLAQFRSEREQIRLEIEALKQPWPLRAPGDLLPPEQTPSSGPAAPLPMPNPLRQSRSMAFPPVQPLDPQGTAAEARRAMQGVTSAIQTEGQNAVSASGAIAEDIKNQFNFTVRPTIAPRLIEPRAAAPKSEAIGKQSSHPAGRSFALPRQWGRSARRGS